MWQEVIRVTIWNQYLDCILANIAREGSLCVIEKFTYTYGFKEAFKRIDLCAKHDICIFKDDEIDRQEIPLGNGVTTWINQGYYSEND